VDLVSHRSQLAGEGKIKYSRVLLHGSCWLALLIAGADV